MKNLINVVVPVLVIGLSGFFLNSANAQQQNTETNVTVGANIAAPLVLTKIEDMHFGSFAAGDGGTVVLPAEDNAERTFDGTTEIPSLGTDDDPKAAEFTLRAHPRSTVNLTFPSTISLTGPDNNTMSVSLTSSIGTSFDFSGISGNQTTFYMGGTITVAEDQEAGDYSGTFELTVAYE